MQKTSLKKSFLIALAALSLLSSLRLMTPLLRQSAGYDEAVRAGAAYALVEQGYLFYDFRNPPLFKYLFSIPLIFMKPSLPVPQDSERQGNTSFYKDHFVFGYAFLFNNRLPPQTILVATRLVSFAFYLLGGILLFLLLRAYASLPSAVLAAILYFFCPTLGSFAVLTSNDLFAAVFTLFMVAGLLYFYRAPSIRSVLAAGTLTGLAFCIKFSLLAMAPFALLVFLLLYLRKTVAPQRLFLLAGLFAVMTALVIEVNYLFLDPRVIFNLVRETLSVAAQGKNSFAFGRYSDHGFPYYFPAAMLLKTPLPALAVIVYSVYLFIRKKKYRDDTLLLLACAIGLFAAATFSAKLNLGLRYVLPLYPLLYLFAGGVITKEDIPRPLLPALFVLLSVSAILVHPHYQSYFNCLIGRNENAYKYFVDSTLDWGQDLSYLGEYLKKEGNPEIILSYFGTAQPAASGIKEYQNLESDGLDMVFDETRYLHLNSDRPAKEYLAVSATCRVGVDYPNRHWFDFLDLRTPKKILGNTIFVYDITGDTAAYRHIAAIYRETGRESHLLRCARVVNNLAPSDPFGRLGIAIQSLDAGALATAEKTAGAITASDLAPGENDMLDCETAAAYLVALIKKGKSDLALAHISRWQGPGTEKFASMWDYLAGISYFRQNRYAEAEQCLVRSLTNKPAPSAFLQLGLVFEKAQDFQKAAYCYRSALRLNKHYLPAYRRLKTLKERLQHADDREGQP